MMVLTIGPMAFRDPEPARHPAPLRGVLRLVAPLLDLVLAAGDRVSRVAGRNQIEPEPPRRSLRP